MGCTLTGLNAIGFFLWGYLKQKVYQQNIKDLDDLRQSITIASNSIKPDVLKRVFSKISRRLNLVISNNGDHIEQLL